VPTGKRPELIFARPASVIFRSVSSKTGNFRADRSLGVAQQCCPPSQNFGSGAGRRPAADRHLFANRRVTPPPRNLPQLRFDEAVGKEVVEVRGKAGQRLAAPPAAFLLGAHRFEIDEPCLEQSACHRLQRFVLLAVEFDLVVLRAEDVGDGALFFDIHRNLDSSSVSGITIQSGNRAVGVHVLKAQRLEQVIPISSKSFIGTGQIKRGVDWPAWPGCVVKRPDGTFSSYDDGRAIGKSRVVRSNNTIRSVNRHLTRVISRPFWKPLSVVEWCEFTHCNFSPLTPHPQPPSDRP